MSDKTTTILGILAFAAVLALAFFVMSGPAQQSIIPQTTSNQYAVGQTVIWTHGLERADGMALFSQLGCANSADYNPVQVSYAAVLDCQTSGGQQIIPSPTAYVLTTVSCNYFTATGAASASLNGQASATIPQGATSCTLRTQYQATKNGVTAARDDSHPVTLGVLAQSPQCSGSYACSGYTLKTCVNGQVSSDVKPCQYGCSNGACIGGCVPNSVTCNGDTWYYQCAYDGTVQSLKQTEAGKICMNGQIITQPTPTPTQAYKDCPDGSRVLESASCPPWCGDGICNNGETSASCLRDCPLNAPECSNVGEVVCVGPVQYKTCQPNQKYSDVSSIKYTDGTVIPAGICRDGKFYRDCGNGAVVDLSQSCPQNQTGQCPLAMPAPPSCPVGQVAKTVSGADGCFASWVCQQQSVVPPTTKDWLSDNWLYVVGGVFVVVLLLIGYYALKKD